VPRPRFDRLDPETKQRLLENAAGEFARHGLDGASLNRVLELSGLSKGVFYYYFDDKADLFATVVRMTWETMLEGDRIDPADLQAASFWAVLETRFFELAERAAAHPWMSGMAVLMYQPPAQPEVRDTVAELFDEARAYLESLVDRGRTLGVVRGDLPSGLLVTMLVAAAEASDRWLAERWRSLGDAEAMRLGREVFGILRRLVEPPPGAER
jgi:AcrR family transcriptional regulator